MMHRMFCRVAQQLTSTDVQGHNRFKTRDDFDLENTNINNNYRPYETDEIGEYEWQDVQGFDNKMMSRRRTLQRTADHLDSRDLDLHRLPVSNWPSLWQHRMQQKRQADCAEDTNSAKRQRTTREAVSSWYHHVMLPTVTTQHAYSSPVDDVVAMETQDEDVTPCIQSASSR